MPPKAALIVPRAKLATKAYRQITVMSSISRADLPIDLLWAMLERLSCGLALVTADGRIRFANRAFAAMHGWEAPSLTGAPFDSLCSPRCPENAAALWDKARSGMPVIDASCLHCRRDGSEFPGEVSAVLIDDARVGPLLAVAITDLTRRKNEQKELRGFRTITDRANYGVASSDCP